MAVVIETTVGDFTVDLFTEKRPQTCLNFLKLCKIKYYNWSLFHSVQSNFIAQTGDPTGTGKGGESVYGIVLGEEARYYEAEQMPKLKHDRTGLISMVNCGNNMLGSQFFITLGSELQSLDGHHCVFGEITEGLEVVLKLNEAICDGDSRPYQDIRISHTVILEDPYDDPKGLTIPDRSPEPTKEALMSDRIGADEAIDDTAGMTNEEIAEMRKEREAKARATILEIVGDLPDAEMAPPENVLFVCKLNPVTGDDDLEIIFSRFGKIVGCEVIRDRQTGDSLQYAFIEFAERKSCEEAYFKMDNVLIDDRRIHVDFSQSVAKMRWRGKGKGIQYFDESQKEKAKNGNHRNPKERSKGDDQRRDKVKSENRDAKDSKDKDRHCSLKEESERSKKDDHRKEKSRDESERRSRNEGKRSFDGRRGSHVRSGDRRDERRDERRNDRRDERRDESRYSSFDNRRGERDRRRVDTEWTMKTMEFKHYEHKRERQIERWEMDNKKRAECERRRREDNERQDRNRNNDTRHRNGREYISHDRGREDDHRSRDRRRDDDHRLMDRRRESPDKISIKKVKSQENEPASEKHATKPEDVKASSTSSEASSSSESDSSEEEKHDKSKKLKKRRHSTSSSSSSSESDEPKSKIKKKKKHKDVSDSADSDVKKTSKKQSEDAAKKRRKSKRKSSESEDLKKSNKSKKKTSRKKAKESKGKKSRKSSSSESESSSSSSDSDSSDSDSRKRKRKGKSKKSNKHKKSKKSRKRDDSSSD